MAEAHQYLRDDPHLQPLIETHGELSIDPADDLFRRLVVSILRQQVSIASARATRERLVEAVEITPVGILNADEETFRNAGLSGQKTRYVRNVASAFQENDYDRTTFVDMSDDEVIDELTSITGVGVWTAKMQLIFSLGREDVFPVEDLGIRKGMHACFDETLSREEMVSRADRWRPYRSYASLYLWRASDG